MLDPREQKKGGFGAFVAREHERQDIRDAEKAHGAPDAAAAPGKGDTAPEKSVNAADGASDGTTAR